MTKRIIFLLIALTITCSFYSQKERGNKIDIKGGTDLIKLLSNTDWELKKIIKKKGLFKATRHVEKSEELQLSFKDSTVTHFYTEKNKKITCKIQPSYENKNNYEFLTIKCEACNFYWIVYRLSDLKLVVKISIDQYKNYDIKDTGRYVFYRKR
jgi:hypothetical protein